MNRKLFLQVALSLGVGIYPLPAEVTPASLFQDFAILQQGKLVPVWGSAEPGETVTVEFAGQKKETTAAADGFWMISLDALAVEKEGRELRIAGKNEIRLKDILVGEVWLCSGQSNMALLVKNAKDFPTERTSATFPLIREFGVEKISTPSPSQGVTGKWITCAPDTVGNFSAVAYFFARRLYEELNVPIGIIHSSWGGTRIEAWMSDATLKETPQSAFWVNRWQKKVKMAKEEASKYQAQLVEWERGKTEAVTSGKPAMALPAKPEALDPKFAPSGLFNAMIHPLLPAALAGVVWYQGEANASRHQEYAPLFISLIKQWRNDFGQPELPFHFVQLPNFNLPSDETQQQWAFMREAQAAALALPHTGMSVTIDLGEAENLHPMNKQAVGLRLANDVLASCYGKGAEGKVPLFEKAETTGDAMRVTMKNARGLHLAPDTTGGFELAGPDKIFHPANVGLEGEILIVKSGKVPQPVAVRYAWKNNPTVCLWEGDEIPVAPFRSDNW